MDRKRTFEKSSCSEQLPKSDPANEPQQHCPCCKQENCLNLACVRQPRRTDHSFGDPFDGSFGLSSTLQDPFSSTYSSTTRQTPFGGVWPMSRPSYFPGGPPRRYLLHPQAKNVTPDAPFWNPPNLLGSFPHFPQREYRTRAEFQAAVAAAFEEAYPCLKGITKMAADAMQTAERNPDVVVKVMEEANTKEDGNANSESDSDSEAKMDTESESESKAAAHKESQRGQKRKSSHSRKSGSDKSPSPSKSKSKSKKDKANRPMKTPVRRCRTKSAPTMGGAKGHNRSYRQTKARSADFKEKNPRIRKHRRNVFK